MKKSHSEKRANKRFKAKDKVEVKVGNGAVHHAQAQLRDVSLKGVYLYLQNKVTEGSTLEVVLPLPAGILAGPENWIRCKCRVVRVENKGGPEYGVAATIEELEPVDTTKLKQA
ncbi:MAG: PilZ domain-containing protein [Terriglobales bacterium]